MKRAILFASAICLACSTTVSAATLFFDFGDSSRTTVSPPSATSYNNIAVNPPGVLSIADAVDSAGNSTGVSISSQRFLYRLHIQLRTPMFPQVPPPSLKGPPLAIMPLAASSPLEARQLPKGPSS